MEILTPKVASFKGGRSGAEANWPADCPKPADVGPVQGTNLPFFRRLMCIPEGPWHCGDEVHELSADSPCKGEARGQRNTFGY